MKKAFFKLLAAAMSVLTVISAQTAFVSAEDKVKPREWYVSSDGDDIGGNGTIENPFKTIQKGADMLNAGDTLVIRGGVYNEKVKINVSGTQDNPITIKRHENESVTIRAVTQINGWTKINGNIWSADMPWNMEDNDQENMLFCDSEALVMGRYPNLSADKSILWPNQLTMDEAKRTSTENERLGYIKDSELTEPDGFWDGAKVRMQSGLNWYNVVADVVSYTKADGLKLRNHTFPDSAWYNETSGDTYYIFDHINTLDTEGEWYYDRENKKMYYYSLTDPNKKNMGARKYDYVFDLKDRSYINFIGLDIRGASPNVSGCSYINFDWCSIADSYARFDMIGDYLTLKNSHIYGFPDGGIRVCGKRNAIFNCLIENTGWYGGSTSAVDIIDAMECYFGYNTVRLSGRTNFSPGGTNSVYEYNHFYDAGSVTCDTGIVYRGVFSGGTSEFRYNWLHDMTAQRTAFGFYLDNANSYLTVHHNVVWDNDNETGKLDNSGWVAMIINQSAQGILVFNNTFIGDGHQAATTGYTEDGRIMNNIFTGQIQENVKYKAQRNNIVGWLDPGFTDMENYDFSLKPDSIAIDKGMVIEGVTDGYVGTAPDIGAYEYGKEYWVPGHNWENPPKFIHATPNYIQYSNRVAQSGFEDTTENMFKPDFYGWQKIGDSLVTQKFFHSLSVIQAERRTGNIGVQLGQNLPTAYPGDNVTKKANEIVEIYNELNEGIVNYPEWKKQKIYDNLGDTVKQLLKSSSELFPKGDFEDGIYDGGSESAKRVNTDEEACGGLRSLKISDMKYSWSGLRLTLPETTDRKFRMSFDIKGKKGDSVQVIYRYHHPTDWDNSEDKFITSKYTQLQSDEWNHVMFDIDAAGKADGTCIEFNYNNWKDGFYYIDNISLIDMTEVYLMQKACESMPQAKEIIDKIIEDAEVTVDKLSEAMAEAVQIILSAKKDAALETIMPVLYELCGSRFSTEAGISYKLGDLMPQRTYKLLCRAWVANEEDSVEFRVKHNDDVLASWQTNSKIWTDYPLLFESPKNGDPITIEIVKPQGIGAAYIDDVAIHEYDPMEYNFRKSSMYLENGSLENGELWPWYSFDGNLQMTQDNGEAVIKVSDGRAMQDIRTLAARKTYLVSGDFKLDMPDENSKQIELTVYSTDNTKNGLREAHNIGSAEITNDGWTHIEGNITVFEKPYGSMGYTAGLLGKSGSFLMKNARVEELPMPTVPGTGDENPSFKTALSDSENWVSSTGAQGFSISTDSISSTNGAIGYTGETYRDFKMTFKMKIENYTPSAYPSLTIRNTNNANSYASGYTFIIRDTNIELQKYFSTGYQWMFVGEESNPTGIYGSAKATQAFKMDEWNTVTVGSQNEEKGVRIYLEINGEIVYDYLDTVSTIDNSGYIVFMPNGCSKIEVKNADE